MFKDIRRNYGRRPRFSRAPAGGRRQHLGTHRDRDALRIKSDTLFFNRQAETGSIWSLSYLYPLADATMIRKMEGAEITIDRLEYVLKAKQSAG